MTSARAEVGMANMQPVGYAEINDEPSELETCLGRQGSVSVEHENLLSWSDP